MKKGLGLFALLLAFLPAFCAARGRLPIPSRPPHLTEAVPSFEVRPFEDDRGGFFLVYLHATSSATALVAQHADAQGTPLWAEPIVVAGRLDTYDAWDAFADGQGGGVVTWVRDGALFVRRFGPEGQLSWSDLLAVSPSTGAVRTPSGVADSSGGAYLVWSQQLTPQRSVLLEQHLSASGQALWKAAQMRVSLSPSEQARPSIVTDWQGGSFVVWNDSLQQASQVQLQRMDSIGDRLFGAQGLLLTAPASLDKEPLTLEPLFAQAQVVFGWTGSQNAVNRVFLQRVDARGKLLWSPQGIAASMGQSNQWNPVVSGAEDGSLWVAWEDNRDSSLWRGFVSHLDPQGRPLLGSLGMPIADIDADQGDVALTDDGMGGIFTAWYDDRTGGSGLYYQAIDARGRRRLPGPGLNLVRGLHDPLSPLLVPLSAGHAAVIWANHPRRGLWGLDWTVVDNHTF